MVPNEDEIYVCRCEEVTVGDIKRAIAAGAPGVSGISKYVQMPAWAYVRV